MRKVILPGLVLYTLSSCLGLFLASSPSNPDLSQWLGDLSDLLPVLWIIGYLFLAFIVSYSFFISKERLHPLPFIVLGVILLNFFIQNTGGIHSSLWPAYFLVTTLAAIFLPLGWTVTTTSLILGIETSNLFFSRQWQTDQWPLYAGFSLSLAVVPAIISHIIHRTRREAEQAKVDHERLLEHADAIDPLADGATIEALSEKSQLASNVKAARTRESSFDGVIDMIYEFVPAHTYALFLKERIGPEDAFVLRARRSDIDNHSLAPIGEVLKPENDHRGIISGCAKHSLPQYLSNMEPMPGILGYYTRNMPLKSILAIPIVQNDNNIGVLVVDSLEGGAFSVETQDMLARFAPFFIQIIDKIRVSQELNIRARTFEAMHKMSSVLNSSLELNEILARLTKELSVLVPFDFCVFALYDEKDRTISIVHHSGSVTFIGPDQSLLDKLTAAVASLGSSDSREETGKSFPVQQGTLINQMLTQWEQGQPAPYHYLDLGERKVPGLLDTTTGLTRQLRSLSCWPLVTGEKFIGAFFLGSLHANAYSEPQRYFLETLMNQVSLVMDNAILHQQISNLARTDGLTGLLNHRTFMGKLQEKYRELERRERPFSILLMDIDKFKNVNDKYGHPVGDIALKAVAGVLKETLRVTDFIARYGGEEFAVGMAETPIKDAEQIAERVRKIMEQTMVTRVFDGELKVQLSIGVSTFPEDTRDLANLVAMADEALYHAKRSGRNKVCLYQEAKASPIPPEPAEQGR